MGCEKPTGGGIQGRQPLVTEGGRDGVGGLAGGPTANRAMRARRLILVLAGSVAVALVLAGGLLLVLPFLIDLPRVQSLLGVEASRLLDRPVRFERVSLSLWPLPAVRVRGLTVADAPGFGPDPFLSVEDVRVRVRLLPLLRGRLSFGDVTLTRARLVVEQRRDGTWNLPIPGGSRPATAAPFALVSRMHLEDGRLEIRLPAETGAPSVAHLVDRIDVVLEDLGWSVPIRLRATARLPGGGLVAGLDGHIGPLTAAGADLAALPARLTARFTAEETRAAASGPGLAGRGDGEIHVEGPLGNLSGDGQLRFTRLTVTHSPPTCARREPHHLVLEAVELPVRIAGPRVTVEPFALRVAGGTVRGSARLSWRAGVPGVRLADVRVQGVSAEPVLVDFLCEPYAVTGRLDGSGEIEFSGTGAELLRTARGIWQVEVGVGRLVGPAALTLLSGAIRVGSALYSVANLGVPSGLLASPIEFQSLAAAGTTGDGQLRINRLAMQGQRLRVTGGGTYGLLDTRLDFKLDVQTRRSTFGVKIGGTAREPSYTAEPRGLIKTLTELLGATRPPKGWAAPAPPASTAGR
jgi:uncharacterized protein involved in outer membrane biogenesis